MIEFRKDQSVGLLKRRKKQIKKSDDRWLFGDDCFLCGCFRDLFPSCVSREMLKNEEKADENEEPMIEIRVVVLLRMRLTWWGYFQAE